MQDKSRFLAVALGLACLTGGAQSNAADVIAVEETWAFTVGQPDATKASPQITATMGPFNTTSGLHFVFYLNHVNQPKFTPGGMQIQVWNNEELLDYRTGGKSGSLLTNGETVRWTQSLTVNNGTVCFEVKNGDSQTWGNFGGQGLLKTTQPGVANLNAYRPYLSLTESGVGFGGNRVTTYQLERIKWTMSTGEVYQLVAPIDIDADLDP